MHTTNLRKVGGSVMLAVPPALLDILDLKAGEAVGIAIDGGRLVIEAAPKPRYSMAELLAASDYSGNRDDDTEWTNGSARGGELL